VGIWALERFADLVGATSWNRRGPFLVFARGSVARCGVILIRPSVWMNNSGLAVVHASTVWDAPVKRTVIVCDDVALPDGRLRLRRSGTAGGHKGLISVIQHLGTDDFPRLRIGVGSGRSAGQELRDYVLEQLAPAEIERYGAASERAALALKMIIEESFDQAMTLFNQDLPDRADSPPETQNPNTNLGGVE
jgi:PTH1 family peptidyl-tRNA hydrolase